jgi:hypothetical protein
VSQMGATIFGWEEPRGLAAVVEELRTNWGYGNIETPDHTAGGDVSVTRVVHLALWGIQQRIRKDAGL